MGGDDGEVDNEDRAELVLCVFQASPLAYPDVNGTEIPLEILDFENEEDALREALDDTAVRLQFEIATDKNLGNFLSQGSKLFHFSGHGREDFLLIENSFGQAQKLLVNEDLKAWIQAGENKLNFAFIASCGSRTAGQTFIDAGVQHVVCVEKNDQLLSHVAATIFARTFYRALANGRTVKVAYDLAVQGVVQSSDVMRTGLDPKAEANKFVLLPEKDEHNISLFPEPSKQKQTTKVHPLRPLSFLPFPPKPFVGREFDMYKVLKSMIAEKEERLVTVTGERGIGKASFAKAIGHYMEKRKMWGEVYWIPSARQGGGDDIGGLLSQILQTICKRKNIVGPKSFHDVDEHQQRIRGRIFNLLYIRKTVIIIDAKKFEKRGMELLSKFLHDLLENTKLVKIIVLHRPCATLAPPKMTRFPSSFDTHIKLSKLDFKSTCLLFERNCALASPNNWSYLKLQSSNMDSDLLSKVLGEGIPTKIIVCAKNIKRFEYEKLVNPLIAVQESDFSQVLSCLSAYMPEQSEEEFNPISSKVACNEEPQPSLVRSRYSDSLKPPAPPVKSQKEVQTRFVPLLRGGGGIFRKKASAYIRPAMKWEKITTVIKGKQETQKLVSDDTSKVVCGKATREYYVLTDDEFRDSYDEKSLKQIPPNTEDQHLRELRQEGFCEYQSKRFVWAKTVSKEDMNFFRRGAATSTTFAYFEAPSYFEAPWGETVRVEMGDYLVMQYPTNGKQNDGVYRIGRDVFLQTYIDTANEVKEPPDSCSHAGARCFTKNCWDDSVMRHQFDLFRMFYHHPVAIEESDKKEADFKKRVKALQERMQLLKDLEIDENDPKMIEKYKAKRCNLRKALYELI